MWKPCSFGKLFQCSLLLEHRKKAKTQNQCDPVLSIKGPCDHRAYFSPCSRFFAGKADISWQGQQAAPPSHSFYNQYKEQIQRLFDKVNEGTITGNPWCCFAFFPTVSIAGCCARQSKAHPSWKLNVLLKQTYRASSFHWWNCFTLVLQAEKGGGWAQNPPGTWGIVYYSHYGTKVKLVSGV